MSTPSSNPITDPRINDVLNRLHARARRQLPGLVAHFALQAVKGFVGAKRSNDGGAKYVRDKLISIDRGQGRLIYMLCRSLQARRVVEFGTSYGVSTLYLAARRCATKAADLSSGRKSKPKRLARPIIELMAPQLREGAIVICDNVGHFPKLFADYLDFVRRPANGFVSTLLPLRGGTELSVKT